MTKQAILSDIHDNEVRLKEAIRIAQKEGATTAICCGDVTSLDTLQLLASSFDKVYLALGNGDYKLKQQTGLIPENVVSSEKHLDFKLNDLKVAAVHHNAEALGLAHEGLYDYVFYGHTHTPWEEKINKTTILNPGEVAGQYGQATFAIFDTENRKATLKLLK